MTTLVNILIWLAISLAAGVLMGMVIRKGGRDEE